MDKGTSDTCKRDAGKPCSGWALTPFAVFAIFYIGLSLAAGDFYKVPMTIAFILASFTAIAFGRKCRLAERIETYAKGMGEPNIMVMCLIFILAGAFAAISKGSGAVEAAVHIAETLVPPRLMVAGIFMVSAFISLAIGTSCGTIAAITPVAMAFASELNLPPAALAGAVISGAMFGDNLSMISDTTIAATRTQGVPMRSKFISNFAIAIPAAIAAFALYCASGATPMPHAPTHISLTDMALVLPYILILVLALAGANVMTLIFAGTALATALGMAVGAFDLWGALDLLGKGTIGMSETLIVAMLAGGLFRTIRENGGIAWLTDKISKFVRGPRSCEAGMFAMTGAVNLFTANNTVAIVMAGPIARECASMFGANPVRMASVIDIAGCVVQGLIPYGAQILIAVGVARSSGVAISSLNLLGNIYYPALLAVSFAIPLALPRLSRSGTALKNTR